MYMICAQVRYHSSAGFLPSFLRFDRAAGGFIWDNEEGRVFYDYEYAVGLASDIINKKKEVKGEYFEVKDIQALKLKLFEVEPF